MWEHFCTVAFLALTTIPALSVNQDTFYMLMPSKSKHDDLSTTLRAANESEFKNDNEVVQANHEGKSQEAFSNPTHKRQSPKLGSSTVSVYNNMSSVFTRFQSIQDEFGTDNMDWDFDEKSREDGYKLTSPEESPYSVMLVTQDKNDYELGICTGTLLTLGWILTATHCFVGEDAYTKVVIIAGASSIDQASFGNQCNTCQKRTEPSQSVLTHPDYSRKMKVRNDIALVKINEPFQKTKSVGPIGLSRQPWRYGEYKQCRLTGFGKVQTGERHDDDNKRKTSYLEVTSPCHCFEGPQMKEYMMCNRPREDYGLCSGDSGGGLICDRAIVAVAAGDLTFDNFNSCQKSNYGIKTKCGTRNTVSLFAQTLPSIHWIESHVPEIRGPFNSLPTSVISEKYLVLVCLVATLFWENLR